jgi:Transposase DDE domain
VAATTQADLFKRQTGLYKPSVRGLADLVASVLACRSANTAEWQTVLPRQTGDEKSKERYVSRFLSNKLVRPDAVMAGVAPEILRIASQNGQTLILMMDQSKISDGFECLMLSIRVGSRAIPFLWKVIKTNGEIGFETQKILLECAQKSIPEGIKILLSADRFYGTAALIALCQTHGWSYRIRLKGSLILQHDGGEITTGEAAKAALTCLKDAELNKTGVKTNIGILHEAGHDEPRIFAMDAEPTAGRVLDYGLRWGIECLFSDFKSRGFCVTKTHLQHADRIERLILVLTIGIYWATSTGMRPDGRGGNGTEKKQRSLLSHFKNGMRLIAKAVIYLIPLPPLWSFINTVGC